MRNERQPDPTPGEIQAACLEIQATWSEAERMRRLEGVAISSGNTKQLLAAGRCDGHDEQSTNHQQRVVEPNREP